MRIKRDRTRTDRPDVGWFTVEGEGHLFLVSPTTGRPQPVCGVSTDERVYPPRGTPTIARLCGRCDAYLFEVYLPQIA